MITTPPPRFLSLFLVLIDYLGLFLMISFFSLQRKKVDKPSRTVNRDLHGSLAALGTGTGEDEAAVTSGWDVFVIVL